MVLNACFGCSQACKLVRRKKAQRFYMYLWAESAWTDSDICAPTKRRRQTPQLSFLTTKTTMTAKLATKMTMMIPNKMLLCLKVPLPAPQANVYSVNTASLKNESVAEKRLQNCGWPNVRVNRLQNFNEIANAPLDSFSKSP